MSSRRTVRQLLVAVLVGILVGGGLMAVTPAGAEVSSALATNWKKIWNKELKPQADQRYYTKKKSNKRYYTKSDSDAKYQPKGNYALNGSSYTKAETYSKAEADAKYQPKGNYALNGSSYTKAESDAKYAPAQPLYRGSYQIMGNTPGAAHGGSASISWGATFPDALTPHYIKAGDPIPNGCSGSSTAPNASAGNLCVFESLSSNAAANRGVCRGGAPAACGTTDPWGAGIYTFTAAAGSFYVYGTWAARPSGPVVNPGLKSPTSGEPAPTGGDPAVGSD
jgi:hypothetical protein